MSKRSIKASNQQVIGRGPLLPAGRAPLPPQQMGARSRSASLLLSGVGGRMEEGDVISGEMLPVMIVDGRIEDASRAILNILDGSWE